MKKHFFIIPVFILISCSKEEKLTNNDCIAYESNVVLKTQQDVDEFNECGYSMINGDVIISGENITNVETLSSITDINGSLGISENKLDLNLNGLRNVKFVGKDLTIILNEGNVNLSGLKNIKNVDGHFIIQSNDNLNSLQGIGKTIIKESFTINQNNNLISLDGIEGVVSYAYCVIQDNQKLSDLCALLGPMSRNDNVLYYIHNNLNKTSSSSLDNTNCSE